MLEFLIIVGVAFVSGAIFGYFHHAKMLYGRILENPDEMIELLKNLKESRIKVADEAIETDDTQFKIEHINNNVYVYASDGTFLAQGSSLEQAYKIIQDRFPDSYATLIPK
jgi:uncharacterized protein YneF (UPF0154 family)